MEGVRNPQLLAPSELAAGLAGEAATEKGFHGDIHRPLGSPASRNTPWPGHGGPAAALRSLPTCSPAWAGKSWGRSQACDEGAQGSPCGSPGRQGSASSVPAMGWVTAGRAPAGARDLVSHHRAMLCAPAWGRGAKTRGCRGTRGLPWAPATSSCRAAQPCSSSSAGSHHPSQACGRGSRHQPQAVPQSLSSCFPAACRGADVSVPVPNCPRGPGPQRNCHVRSRWCHLQ